MADVDVIVSRIVASARISKAWASGDTCWESVGLIERSTNEIRALIIDVVNYRSCD